MTKQDVPLPDTLPVKRKQWAAALDLHLAMWADDPSLTPSQRRKVREERERRKDAPPRRTVGLLVGQEGMTPEQFDTFRVMMLASLASEVHHPGVASRVHGICRKLRVPVHRHGDALGIDHALTRVVRESDVLLAAPKSFAPEGGRRDFVWDAVKSAKHRSVPITVILPDGTTQGDG